MGINWGEVEDKFANDFKDYAPYGKHMVKVVDAETKQVGAKGNYIIKFKFEEGEYKYPDAEHWISKNNNNWRYHHMKQLFVVLGAPEEKAKQVIEKAEEKGDYEFAVKAYEASFKRLLAKKPEVEIEVVPDGKYSRAKFTDSRVRMKDDTDKVSEVVGGEVVPTDIPNGELDLSNIPF